MTPLTTKGAEIRAGLVERLREHVRSRGGLSRDAETGEIVLPNGAWAMMLEAAALIEQQAAELAEARAAERAFFAEFGEWQRLGWGTASEKLKALLDAADEADRNATTAESERDELLREKERHWGGIRECPQEPSGAGAIRTKHDLDYFDGHDADGDDEGSWEPWFDQFVTALGAYINCRDEQVTVRAAGDVFNVADAVILKAVEEHYWLFASGPSDDPTKQIIEMDGE